MKSYIIWLTIILTIWVFIDLAEKAAVWHTANKVKEEVQAGLDKIQYDKCVKQAYETPYLTKEQLLLQIENCHDRG